jgi:hypothetical protein
VLLLVLTASTGDVGQNRKEKGGEKEKKVARVAVPSHPPSLLTPPAAGEVEFGVLDGVCESARVRAGIGRKEKQNALAQHPSHCLLLEAELTAAFMCLFKALSSRTNMVGPF